MIMRIFALLFLMLSAMSFADDTEIYLNSTGNSAVRPNIMFIMDTSGSMGWDAPVSRQEYDPNTTYTGSYNSSRYYEKNGNNYSQVAILCDTLAAEIEAAGLRTGPVIGMYHEVVWWIWRYWEFDGYDCDNGRAINNPNAERRRSTTLWDGNYLNYQSNPPSSPTQSRMQVARQAFVDVINGLSDVNAGLMHFGPDADGGTIDVPVSAVEDVRANLINRVNNFATSGGTPLAESVYEAMLYFKGDNVNFGSESDDGAFTDSSKTTYRSPITESCQTNHVVLFTDGVATSDNKTDGKIKSLLATVSEDRPDEIDSNCKHKYNDDTDTLENTCLEELAFSIYNSDHSDLTGSQPVHLYTIGGFDLAQTDFLETTASLGGGQYKAANDAENIVESLTQIINEILSTSTTFTAPAVSVNAFNASEHRDELYYALFQPEKTPSWPGNLKKYSLNENGMVMSSNNTPAIDTDTGFFNVGAKDFWNATDDADGASVIKGGFSNLLDANSRTVVSESGPGPLIALENVATKALYNLEGESDENFEKTVNWSRGFDVKKSPGTGTRHAVSDPLHSEPLVITYGGSKETPDASIFFGTNEGFIHALSTDTGSEHFAYLPSELMQHQPIFYSNSGTITTRPYGMDGYISAWINDMNDNNVIYTSEGTLEDNEHIYIYAGMRRGGRNYYALDVTNRSAPALKFIIKGGEGNFARLGQTWSKAVVAKINFNGEEKVVLVFGGGYDDDQDDNTIRTGDDIGNALYIVDAETGERIWWASNTGADLNIPGMDNSIPASPTPIDIDSDGFIDYLIAADMGGRIIRIDFNHSAETIETFASGGIIADLSGSAATNNRRFYNQPSVSLVQDKQLGDYLSIAIGSGHRAHPISTTVVNNRMYVIRDRHPYKKPEAYTTITEAAENYTGGDLTDEQSVDSSKVYNATTLMTGGTSALTPELYRLMSEGSGFYITLAAEGEKVLSRATTFSGAIFFTTFSPTGTPVSTCGPDSGLSKIYAIDQKWGIPVLDLDKDGFVNENDGSTSLAHSGIAPRPVVIYRSGGKKTIAIGTENLDDHRFNPDSQVKNTFNSDSQKSECTYQNCNTRPIYWRINTRDFSYD